MEPTNNGIEQKFRPVIIDEDHARTQGGRTTLVRTHLDGVGDLCPTRPPRRVIWLGPSTLTFTARQRHRSWLCQP